MVALKFIVAFVIGLCSGALVTTMLASSRHNYLSRGEPFLSLSLLLGLVFAIFYLACQTYYVGAMLRAMSPRLGLHRSALAGFGLMIVGIGIGLLITGLFDLFITVGHTGAGVDPDAPAWRSGQWFVYRLPHIATVVCLAIGAGAIALGAPAVRQLAAFLAEANGRRKRGMMIAGRVSAADAVPGVGLDAAPSTRVITEFLAPDGVRQVLAVVDGDARAWLPGVKAKVYVDRNRPYDPAGILIEARNFWHVQWMLAVQAPAPEAASYPPTMR